MPVWRKSCLLLALLLFLSALTPAAGLAEVPGQKKIADAVEEGREQIDALPRTYASDVIGYSYYKNLPSYWEGLQRAFDFFQFRISDAFTNMGRTQYYFTMALTMCAKAEPISWANAAGLQDILGVDGDNFAFEQIMRMLELASDEHFIGEAADMLEWARGLKAVNYTITSLSAFCESLNQQALLASLDWEQVDYLAEAWIRCGNKELAQVGRTLRSLKGYSGTAKDFVSAMSILGKAGLDTIVSEAISMSLDAAAGTAAFVYKAALFGVDAVTRFSVLTGNFNDMIYASEALAACQEYHEKARKNFFFSPDDDYYFGNESCLVTLNSDFSWVMYTGMNFAQACAVMNDTYVNYIEIGKTSLAGKAYIDDTMIRRAQTAKEDAAKFRNQATQLKNQLDLFRYLLEHPWDEPDTPDYSDVWAHYWVRIGEPATYLDITRNGDGTLNMHAHFHQVLDFNCTLDPYDYQVIDYAAPGGEIEGYLIIRPLDGGTLELSILEGSPAGSPGSRTYDYFSKSFIFSTDNPPDLSKYGWTPEDDLPPDENVILTEEEARRLFSRLSETPLMAGSGAGAWEGRLKINADGTFLGVYGDADADMVYQSFFSGSFSRNVEVCGHTYWLWVEELTTQHVPGTRGVDQYGDPVTYIDAPFSDREYMVLTLPGTPDSEIPEMVRGEIGGVFGEWEDYSRFYTLTRLDDGWGFFADPADPPEGDLEPFPIDGEEEITVNWTGIWQARHSESRLYIFREEGGLGDYQVIHTMKKNGETRAIRGSLYFLDEITVDYDVPGIVHGAIVGDPYGSALSLTPFSAVDDRMLPWMQVIEDEYEYIASLDDPAGQIDPSIWDLVTIGLDPIVTPAPTQAPALTQAPYTGNGQVLVEDEICTIVNLGKEMRPANGDLYPRPRYRLAVVNHNYVPIYIQPGKAQADASLPGLTLGTVDGNGLDYLVFDENGQRDYQNSIITVPPDATVEMVLEPVAYGYGFRSTDELVNTDVFINVGYHPSAWQVREYELRMDEGPAYPRPAIKDYPRGGTVTLDLTFEIPDTWKRFYEINGELFEGNLETEDLIKYLKGELSIAKHYLPPPSPNNCAVLVRTHFGTTPEREANGYEGLPWYNRLDDIMIDGQPACVVRYQMLDTPLIVHLYFLTNQDGTVTEIETVSDGSDASDAIIQRLVNSIRFTIYDPEPVTPAPVAPDLSAWTGYWMTHDDSLAEMIITDNGNGTLHAQAMFLPAGDSEATLTPQAEGSMRFEDQYGHLIGLMIRQPDGGLHLALTGGSTMEDEEATEYQGYFARGFTYYPASYADMWYQTPEDAAAAEEDWLGVWQIMGGAGDSMLSISRENGGLHVTVSMGALHFSGMGERFGDAGMDLYTDDFGCMLLLNKKLNRIAMLEVSSDAEAVYDWVGNAYYGVVLYQREDDSLRVPGELPRDDLPPISILPVPTAPGAGQRIVNLPTPTLAPDPISAVPLLPIPGKPGYLQVPIAHVDATSWIVGKDPTAYTPERMIDGEETTAFQFSTKTTPLGQEYLTFAFASPATLDELWMKNGFWKITNGMDQYTRNSRVKKMTIEVMYDGASGYQTLKTVSLKDDTARKDWKVINMLHVQNVTAVRIRIDEIFQGSKFPTDVCVSEMMFVQHAGQ